MKNIMNLALVNYQTVWGDKKANLERISDYCEEAGKRGADMIVFPETALTGYERAIREKEMQHEERMMLGEGISRETYDSE